MIDRLIDCWVVRNRGQAKQ